MHTQSIERSIPVAAEAVGELPGDYVNAHADTTQSSVLTSSAEQQQQRNVGVRISTAPGFVDGVTSALTTLEANVQTHDVQRDSETVHWSLEHLYVRAALFDLQGLMTIFNTDADGTRYRYIPPAEDLATLQWTLSMFRGVSGRPTGQTGTYRLAFGDGLEARVDIASKTIDRMEMAARPETWLLSPEAKSFLESGPIAQTDSYARLRAAGKKPKVTHSALLKFAAVQSQDSDFRTTKAIIDQFGEFIPGLEDYMLHPHELFSFLQSPLSVGSNGAPNPEDTVAARIIALDAWAVSAMAEGTDKPAEPRVHEPRQLSRERIPFDERRLYVLLADHEVRAEDLEDMVRYGGWSNPDWIYAIAKGVDPSYLHHQVALDPRGSTEQRILWGAAQDLSKVIRGSELSLPRWVREASTAAGMDFSADNSELHQGLTTYDDYPPLFSVAAADGRTNEEISRTAIRAHMRRYGVTDKHLRSLQPEALELIETIFINRLAALREQYIDDQREAIGVARFDGLSAKRSPSKHATRAVSPILRRVSVS